MRNTTANGENSYSADSAWDRINGTVGLGSVASTTSQMLGADGPDIRAEVTI
jgi:hypothetical protein